MLSSKQKNINAFQVEIFHDPVPKQDFYFQIDFLFSLTREINVHALTWKHQRMSLQRRR